MATVSREKLIKEVSCQCKISQRLARHTINAILATIIEEFYSSTSLTRRGSFSDRFWHVLRRKRETVVQIQGFGRFYVQISHLMQFHSALYRRRVRARRVVRMGLRPGRAVRERVSGQLDSSHHTKLGTPRRRLLGRDP